MRILMVGGTGFLGKASAEAAIAAGNDGTGMTRSGAKVATGARTPFSKGDWSEIISNVCLLELLVPKHEQ